MTPIDVIRAIDRICHTPSNGQHAYTHFMRDFDAIRKLAAPFRADTIAKTTAKQGEVA